MLDVIQPVKNNIIQDSDAMENFYKNISSEFKIQANKHRVL
jgi:hypothetical protein